MDTLRGFKRRTLQKTLQAVGKAQSTADDDFEVLYASWKSTVSSLESAHAECKKMLDALHTLSTAGASASRAMELFYGPTHVNDPAAAAATRFREAQADNEGFFKQIEAKFVAEGLAPLQRKISELNALKARVEERKAKLLEYDAYKRKVKNLQETKPDDAETLSRNMRKLQVSQEAYEEVNQALLASMSSLHQNKPDLVRAELAVVIATTRDLFEHANNALQRVGPTLGDTGHQTLAIADFAYNNNNNTSNDYSHNSSSGAPSPTMAGGGAAAYSSSSSHIPQQQFSSSIPSPTYNSPPIQTAVPTTSTHFGDAPAFNPNSNSTSPAVDPFNPFGAPVVDVNNNNANMEASKAAQVAALAAGRPVIERCRALCEYTRADDSEMSFQTGDIIAILEKHESGWWLGENETMKHSRRQLEGSLGLLPSNFVQAV